MIIGTNLSGAEFGAVPGVYGFDYTYPTSDEVDYYAGKRLGIVRLPFLWERIQPTLNGPLDPAELARLDTFVSYATGRGIWVALDVHNYGQRNVGGVDREIGVDPLVPNAAFADLWSKLANHFKTNQNVMLDLMNEPYAQTPAQWLTSVNAAIAAIRAAGSSQLVLVEGTSFSGAWTWVSSGNAAAFGTGIIDPAANNMIQVHQYLDSDGSGTHDTVVSATIGPERLAEVTTWARANGKYLFLGELGVARDALSLTALDNTMQFMVANPDVWQFFTWWSAGPWWGPDYMFTLEPVIQSPPVDRPQMTVLQRYI